MKTKQRKYQKAREGSALICTVFFAGILGMTVLSMLNLSAYKLRTQHARTHWLQSYYHAENAMNWAGQMIADAQVGGTNAPFLGQYSLTDGTLPLEYMVAAVADETSPLQNVWVTVENNPSGQANLYQVTTSAKVGRKVRTIQATIRKNPPSQIFDYEYFLNNWGWWWGNTITGNGANRSNWDFDFRKHPTVNGGILANGDIEENMVPVDPFGGSPPFGGLAGSDPFAYVHSGVPRLPMPNLLDLSYYKQKAMETGGTLHSGPDLAVNAVHDNAAKPGVYLVGTTTDPIVFNGVVVVPGDVVISGVMTGIGTLYVGGNLYIAGNLVYANGPDFSVPPETMPAAARDQWVEDSLVASKDLVAFAVYESIYAGSVNDGDWKDKIYNAGTYGLKHQGDESSLGADGIPDTPDDGQKYLDTNGDDIADSAWYDVDNDGIVDGKYNYNADIEMTPERAQEIFDYPLVEGTEEPMEFKELSTNDMNRLDGFFYCNHATGMRLKKDHTIWNGGIVTRDEAIVFKKSLILNYDPRFHSRYSDDPNRFIDLNLPIAKRIRLLRVDELAPVEGFYASAE